MKSPSHNYSYLESAANIAKQALSNFAYNATHPLECLQNASKSPVVMSAAGIAVAAACLTETNAEEILSLPAAESNAADACLNVFTDSSHSEISHAINAKALDGRTICNPGSSQSIMAMIAYGVADAAARGFNATTTVFRGNCMHWSSNHCGDGTLTPDSSSYYPAN